ncbi:VPLPA-CTERM sorting domain-containing protein [Methylomonas koyamae]|uniref:VPLPA-CTERM sorting domain-containing protein n=1 Tax=Methylomonas koyamae TaxID=702114 RepID=UPI002873C920|nr:VPLPA-CTERM sorting domain-containing protein [Methylomonas koyamae]WNB76206.1 VPLPA-CTERM sorting domain-containing protein [Methylomonas koyamae]
MKKLFALSAVLLSANVHAGPFAPAAGQAGSTAIHKDDASFVDWASGWQNYLPGTDLVDSWKTPAKALGKAVGDSFDIVSLGNGGQITLTFDNPIMNGAGYDFAIFENSFSDTFLELAFVEVSSNGNDFFRFANYSYTPSAVGAFGAVDPTNLYGYAGKYKQGFGTPFDLTELTGITGLDLDNINYVRLIDVLGNGSENDALGNKIYDPYKTVQSAGFDLDAIGVLHQNLAVAEVPLPASVWLLISALPFFGGLRRKTPA